jgi:hypothetical protein
VRTGTQKILPKKQQMIDKKTVASNLKISKKQKLFFFSK